MVDVAKKLTTDKETAALNVGTTLHILLAKVSICSHHNDCIADPSFEPGSETDTRDASEVISNDAINSQSTAKATQCLDKLEKSIGNCTCLAQSSVLIKNQQVEPSAAKPKSACSVRNQLTLFHKNERKSGCKQVYGKIHFYTFCSAQLSSIIH